MPVLPSPGTLSVASPNLRVSEEANVLSNWTSETAEYPAAGISCVICAYNEGDRLAEILDVVSTHPALCEVIVVNDGSTDHTDRVVNAFPSVRSLSYRVNRGKTYAMTRGVTAARGRHVMFLDADLAGLGPKEIDRLAAPITAGRAEVTLSLRRNSLGVYRAMGLDFVSGERVLPLWLLRDQISRMADLPRWGAEAFLNDLVIRANLSVEVVDWPAVLNVRKLEKVGIIAGAIAEMEMILDALRVLSPLGVIGQNLALLRLIHMRGHAQLPGRIGSILRNSR
jgi:hypothetical protein